MSASVITDASRRRDASAHANASNGTDGSRRRRTIRLTAAFAAAIAATALIGASPANADETGNVQVGVMLASDLFFGARDGEELPPATVEVYDATGDGLAPAFTFASTADGLAEGLTIDLPPGQYRIRASAEGYEPAWAPMVADGGVDGSGDEALISLIDAFHPFTGAIGFEDAPVLTVEAGDESPDAPAHVYALVAKSTSYIGGVVFGSWLTGDDAPQPQVDLFRVGQGSPARTMVAEDGVYVLDDVARGSYQLRFTVDGVEQWWPFEASRSRAATISVTAAGGGWVALDAAFQEPMVAEPGEYLSISGDPAEGGVLSLAADLPAPFDNPELSTTDRLSNIAWLVDGEPVPGATGATFVVPSDAVGREISATAEATQLLGYDRRWLATEPVGPVEESELPPISPAAVPTVAGTPQVGQQLTSTLGTWRAGTTRTFQWNRDGVPIAGATGRNYTLKGTDAGAHLTFTVTGTRPGSQVTIRTSDAVGPIANTVFATPVATIKTDRMAATPRVGDDMRAVHGAWGPAAETWNYEWLRDGVPIGDATGDRYTVSADDLGATIAVRITGSGLGYDAATAQSATTGVVTEGRFAADKPTISPVPKVGVESSVVLGSWTPAPESVDIRWMRGQVLLGTGPTYTPTAADANRNIRVVVVGSSPGFIDLERAGTAVLVVP